MGLRRSSIYDQLCDLICHCLIQVPPDPSAFNCDQPFSDFEKMVRVDADSRPLVRAFSGNLD